MDRDSVEVFLPDPDECYERLRRAETGATVSCVYCGESDPVIEKGTTGKDAHLAITHDETYVIGDAHVN